MIREMLAEAFDGWVMARLIFTLPVILARLTFRRPLPEPEPKQDRIRNPELRRQWQEFSQRYIQLPPIRCARWL